MAYLWTCPACGRAQRRDRDDIGEHFIDQLRTAAASLPGMFFGPAIRHYLAMLPGTCRNIDCAASYEAHLWRSARERRAALVADLAAGRLHIPSWPFAVSREAPIKSPSDDTVDAIAYALGWLERSA